MTADDESWILQTKDGSAEDWAAPTNALEGVVPARPLSESGPTTPPPGSEVVEVVRGWRTHPDGSHSPVERWVRHADGDWVSLDSERRTSGDILMDLGPSNPPGQTAPPAP